MKTFILTGLLIVAVAASVEDRAEKFQTFKTKHGKTYINQVEETKRYAIFIDNLRSIEEHNALYEQGLVSYKKGINQFTDKTQEEFRALLNMHTKPIFNGTRFVETGIEVPSSVDWREQGYVTEVKDQGQCGSCWAFSVTGTVEGAYYRKSGQLVSLSEQQLVDCTTSFNFGCDGGWMYLTVPYILENGIQSEESYPYTALDGSCQYDASKIVTKVSDYVLLNTESALLEAVATVGPVSVDIDATYLSYYSSGIYSDNDCSVENLNHGVLVVGYGSENGQDYWIVKNSWGQSWGENGYFKIVRGTNECGIAADDVYPIIN